MNNKWTRAAIPALLIHCSIGIVYCWSSFSAKLASQIGTSTSVIGWAFSLAIFFLGMSAAFTGRFVEKDVHRVSLISCICFTAGMIGTGLCIQFTNQLGVVATIIGIFIFYGCVMGIGLGIGYISPVKTLMLWFKDNKGLGTGISIMGFGLAKAIASPVMNVLQDKVGLAAMFYILGSIYFVMMLIGHFLLKKPDGWVEPADKVTSNPFAIFRNKTFIGIWIMFYINITCGLALISYEKNILKSVGLGLVAISAVQIATAAANAVGRIGFSTISDYCKDRNTVYKIILGMSIGISVFALVTRSFSLTVVPIVVILLILINLGYGGGFSTLPALLSSRFGMSKISEIHGVSLSAWAIAGLTGNQITAAVQGRTGSYEPVLLVLAILYAIALFTSFVLVRQGKKENIQ